MGDFEVDEWDRSKGSFAQVRPPCRDSHIILLCTSFALYTLLRAERRTPRIDRGAGPPFRLTLHPFLR